MPIEKTLANEPAFHQQAFVAYLTIPSGSKKQQLRHDNSISCKAEWHIYRDTEQP